MKKISIICKGCGHEYTLGKNAIVVTLLDILVDSKGVTIFGNGSSSVDNHSAPDLVDSLPRSWDTLEPAIVSKQETTIKRISTLKSQGISRWWKCRKCGNVQTY